MITPAKNAPKGGNSAVHDNMTKRGVPAKKATETAKKFRRNANRNKSS